MARGTSFKRTRQARSRWRSDSGGKRPGEPLDLLVRADASEARMRCNHVHVGVRDLGRAVEWFDRVWRIQPNVQNERLATYGFGSFMLILDLAPDDTPVTLGFESDDCDRDYRAVIERGAVAMQEPSDRAWGARAAYVKGPGAMKLEVEGPLKG